MTRILMTTAAAVVMTCAPAAAQTTDNADMAGQEDRRQSFSRIDANGDDILSRYEFTEYWRRHHGLSAYEADMLYDEITEPDDRLTLIIYEQSDALNDWDRRANVAANSKNSKDGKNSEKPNADMLNQHNREAMNSHFAAMDKDDDLVLSRQEFVSFIAQADNVSRSDAGRLFDAAAGDDDKMTVNEFVEESPRLEKLSETAAGKPSARLKAGYASDNRKAGDMDASDDKKRAHAVAKQMFETMDENGNDRVTRTEYLDFAREKFSDVSGNDDVITWTEFREAGNRWERSAMNEQY